jgi:stearoyl-CoA desaturase (delta-9 desaturase)
MLAALVVLTVLISQLAVVTTTVYLHRYLAHGGIELRPEARAVARVVIWITTALKPRQWAQVHRLHHAGVDTPDDPHSPENFGGARRGAWHVFWRNAPLYTRATRNPRLAEKYRDLKADRWDRWLFDRGELGLAIGVSIASALTGALGYWLIGGWLGVVSGIAVGLLASALHAAFYVLAGGAINGFGHAHPGKQRYGGHATNMPVVAWLTGGEGWHRNHHAAENSPRLGWGHQLDPGWLTIRGLQLLRLAHVTPRGAIGMTRLNTLYTPGDRG